VTRRRTAALALAALLAAPACGDPDPKAGPTPSAPASSTAPATATTTTSATPSGDTLAATIARFGAKKLDWNGCGSGFECAKLTVPLDYDAPDAETIDVAVIRLKTKRQSSRIGSLVLNPGGPGGSGIEFARNAEALLPAEIRDRFDTVSFDPRGVGQSAPVDCLDDRELDTLLAIDPSPDSPGERKTLLDAAKEQAQACKTKSGKLLAHVATIDTAKDMDVLRTALGDKKLTYLGYSYGTLLGARYAQQFPGNVRALVLDGAVDPTLSPRQTTAAQAAGFDRALEEFLADCASDRCAFAGHGPIDATFDELMASADKRPLSASQYPGRSLGPSEALFGVAAALYSREYGWPVLRDALEQAYSQRDGSGLLRLFDNIVERDEQGHFSNSVEAQAAVLCTDGEYDTDTAAYDADSVDFAKKAPRFGKALAYGPVVCAYWGVPPVTKAGPITAPGSAPIVVVGTTRDPATPYAWSQSMAKQLDAALLTYEGDGHTAYGYSRSQCVNRVVDAYLISLTVPKEATRC
jgi:pimeloyl-ACP methyl ester carboxylesterase